MTDLLPHLRLWIAVLMAADALVALLGWRVWQRLIPQVNIRRLATVELAAAAVLMGIHVLVTPR